MMTLGRQELLVALAIVFLLGLALTISRLIEARKSGLSFRLQVFLPLAATTLTLSAPVRWLQRKRVPGRVAAAFQGLKVHVSSLTHG